MVKPITPKEVKARFAESLPDFVIEAVNGLIVKQGASSAITIKQKNVVSEIIRLAPADQKVTSAVIRENHWLDFEEAFEAAGWKVEYDKPGFNETYDAFWNFTPKRRRLE